MRRLLTKRYIHQSPLGEALRNCVTPHVWTLAAFFSSTHVIEQKVLKLRMWNNARGSKQGAKYIAAELPMKYVELEDKLQNLEEPTQ